jgi:threonine/homoserine/homoserine lactone efflux protein
MFQLVVLGTSFAFAAAVQPGPLQAYLVSQSLAHGFRRTFPAAFAPIVSDVPIATIILLILTNIPPGFVLALQFIGGAFLLYLAYGAYSSFRNYQQTAAPASVSVRQTFFKAVLVNLLNPNAYIGWGLIMGPLVASAWHQSIWTSLAVILAFYVTMIATTLVILALFGRARSLGPWLGRLLIGLSAAALGLFGLYQIWHGGRACLQLLGVLT